MILYNVTVSLDPTIEKEWLSWMREVHIPDVMATKKFIDHKIFRLMHEVEGGKTYAIQYFALEHADIHSYQQEHAPRLQAATKEKFGEKALAFRTLLEEVR